MTKWMQSTSSIVSIIAEQSFIKFLFLYFFTMSTFLPDSFESPKTSGQYLKIQDGETIRLRILSKPIFFWQWWSLDNKPMRVAYDGSFAKTPEWANPEKKSQFVWAMVVYNYNESKVQIWSPSQASFKNALESYARDEDIGDPQLFDIKIGRKGQSMETEYSITPLMKQENMKPMSQEILDEAKKVNLNALITNDNPFEEKPIETPF